MSWAELLPPMLVACALLCVGVPITLAAGARGFNAIALGLGASLGVIGAASVIAPMLGMSWSVLPVVLVAVILTLIAFGLRRLSVSRRHAPAATDTEQSRPSMLVPVLAGWIGGGVILTGFLVVALGGPDHPNQLFDAVFHLNATRFVIETGSASPFDMTLAIPEATSTFYPTVWHALTALTAQLTGIGVVPATNAVTIAVVAFVWPAAVMFLTMCLWPRQRMAVALAGVFSAGFALFPLGFLSWGVLYPNLLSTVAVPIALGAAVVMLNRAPRDRMSALLSVLVFVLVLGGVSLAHPSGVFAVIVLGAPLALSTLIGLFQRAHHVLARTGIVALAFALIGAALLLWRYARPSDTKWLPFESIAHSSGEALWLAPIGRPLAVVLAALAIVGVIVELKRRRFWVVGAHTLAIALFVVAASASRESLRTFIVGVWYNDTTRVAALLAIIGIPLAAAGGNALWAVVARQPFATRMRGSISYVLIALVFFGLLAAGSQVRTTSMVVPFLRDETYAFNENSFIVSPDEVELFDDVASLVPEGELIAGNPWSGASLVYAYTGNPALLPHLLGRYGDDRALVARELSTGSAAACAAAERIDLHYVLDFGDRYVISGRGDHVKYAGLNDLDSSPVLTPVAHEGDAALYEITGCD